MTVSESFNTSPRPPLPSCPIPPVTTHRCLIPSPPASRRTELPPTALWKNLWRTNNLEQYRGHAAAQDGVEEAKGEDDVAEGAQAAEGANGTNANTASFRYPKVLITVRSELLSSEPNYRSNFVPLEGQNKDKDEEREAINYLYELRFVPFGDKREQYQSQVG